MVSWTEREKRAFADHQESSLRRKGDAKLARRVFALENNVLVFQVPYDHFVSASHAQRLTVRSERQRDDV